MESTYAASAYGTNTMGYDDNVQMFLEDVSRQTAHPSQSRNRSSMSNGQRSMTPMRVTKPSSTNNSPRCSVKQNRRRTLMSDGSYQRQLNMLAQQPMMATNEWAASNEKLPTQMPTRMNRPVSWHPSSQQQMYQPVQAMDGYQFSPEYYSFDASTPSVYSGYASPDLGFSPMSMPCSEDHHSSYPFSTAPTSYPLEQTYNPDRTPLENPMMDVQTSYLNNNQDPTMYSHFDWNNFAANGFDGSDSPPTPDNFLPIQHPEPTFTPEEAIPYLPLSEDEAEGEVLIGIGLYHTPDNSKTSLSDPQLDNYRMMSSQLMGNSYRRPEPTGKGLKLEETWQPPTEKDDDDEEDGEGEEEDEEEEDEEEEEEEEEVVPEIPVQMVDTTAYMMGTAQNFPNFDANYATNCGGTGWF